MISQEVLNSLENLQSQGLVENAYKNIKKWLDNSDYTDFWAEITELIKNNEVDKLNNAFYQVIPFGTGGRRGMMGAGTNRINSQTIAESAQGFVDYLIETFGLDEAIKRGVAITYDARHNSEKFARTAAEVFTGNGVKTYFYDGVRSTPQLSFTIRYLQALGGVMISASHNPSSDNGIKVYWQHGGQLVPPHDANVIAKVSGLQNIKKMDFVSAEKSGVIVLLDQKIDEAYQETVGKLSLGNYRSAKIVFTPLHGCASTSFLPVLKKVGFKNIFEVKEQMSLDPDFSNIDKHIPNPEVPIAMRLATEYAKTNQADLSLAADPDADRIGVVSRKSQNSNEYVFLNGNQIGTLLLDYITKGLKAKGELQGGKVIKTVVTTDLVAKIAEDNGLDVIGDLPVGFKYIADAMDKRLVGKKFIFGAEESHGYLYGDYARDKDGAVAALLICEYASFLKEQNFTLYEQLENIKKQYGYYRELLLAVFYTGMDGMEKMNKIMSALRNKLPTEFAGQAVVSVLDQLNKKFINPQNGEIIGEYEGFSDNALIFYLNQEKTIRLVVRPSGTEPKIKYYAAVGQVVGLEKTAKEYKNIKNKCDGLAGEILEDIARLAESICPGGNRFEILG